MAMGASNSPRRQTSSQGAVQTRPQIAGKGFGSDATWSASSYLPSAIRLT